MRKLLFVLIPSIIFCIFSCDDGDIITFNIDFDDTFEACNGVSGLVLYKTKDDPSESLSVFINGFTRDELFEVNDNGVLNTTELGTFYYRTYSNERISNIDLFCTDVPDDEIDITMNDDSDCSVVISTTLIEDDNDGVPTALENPDPNGDGIYDDAQDTDGDGLPDYKDADDDGDNVLTKDENPDPNEDGNVSDAQDTDGDGTPDYLDSDDDGDGALTRDEEKGTQDQNLGNDITNPDVGPDYLNPEVSDVLPAVKYRVHSFTQTFNVTVTIRDIEITELKQESLDFGILEGSGTSGSQTITPEFN
ncbi:hypothetical protein [Seonamhaeicola aphaedonensis]|uniref:Thrombospondin type 3 repeat-containing protein n=1 Tax=Seonamhaeicola aphaedonensis TaxID=1461338 RepID=A0A3D9HL37_9FLAO|nr:hypothetical protein [Seonamhaeicola aphaedonensis]RED49616.1 hypothetical protein DFQ02_102395 [Seonamhaeicola aphaedonensis]